MKCISRTGTCPARGCEKDGVCYLRACVRPIRMRPSSPRVDRILAVRFCLLGALAIAALLFVSNLDFSVELAMEAEEKDARPQRAIEIYRELQCDCTPLNAEREPRRYQITHKPDKKLCYVTCEYGTPAFWIAETL